MAAIGRDTAITWLGHAAFHLETPGGLHVLVDPFLNGNPKCPEAWKQPERADLILITHAHNDHVGDTQELAKRLGSTVVAMVELGDWLEMWGVPNVVAMNKGGTYDHQGVQVTLVHALHSGGINTPDTILYGGEAAGLVVRMENGFTIYFAGDTCAFSDMRIIGELHAPDLAVLPIGDHYTMGPREAAYALGLLGVKRVIPCHYGTFPVLTGTPDELRRHAPEAEVIAPEPGETVR